MHIITIKGMSQEGAYAVVNEYGEKVVFMFEEKEDAERYVDHLEAQGDPPMNVITIKDSVALLLAKGVEQGILLLVKKISLFHQ